MHKGGKPFTTNYWHNITYASPNKNELYSIFSAAKRSQEPGFETDDTDSQSEEHVIQECIRMSKDILQKVQCLVITLGKHGVLICRNSPTSDPLPVRGSKVTTSGLVSAVHYPAVDEDVLPADKIKSVSGAGDR